MTSKGKPNKISYFDTFILNSIYITFLLKLFLKKFINAFHFSRYRIHE